MILFVLRTSVHIDTCSSPLVAGVRGNFSSLVLSLPNSISRFGLAGPRISGQVFGWLVNVGIRLTTAYSTSISLKLPEFLPRVLPNLTLLNLTDLNLSVS